VRYLAAAREARERGEIPDGSYQWVEVYELDGDTAVALPRHLFRGPRDTAWVCRGRLI
jgi:hypothetical protein